jgi:excisionase family DNA binding protein
MVHPLLLDIKQTGEVLNVSRATIYRLLDRGELRAVSIGSRRLVSRSAILDYIEKLEGDDQ